MGVNLKRTALYPGTFDPITKGHLDIIKRGSNLFDEIIVAVAISKDKKPMFTLEQRVEMISESTQDLTNIKIVTFENLTVELAKEQNASTLIRGIRSVSDFEYELQLNNLNNSLDDSIESIYLLPKVKNSFVSSSAIRTLIKFDAKIKHLLPKEVYKLIKGYN